LRLRYEIRRELAPYTRVKWEKLFGGTADYARQEGQSTGDLQFVVGIRAWF
jgi:copper resistance protein B